MGKHQGGVGGAMQPLNLERALGGRRFGVTDPLAADAAQPSTLDGPPPLVDMASYQPSQLRLGRIPTLEQIQASQNTDPSQVHMGPLPHYVGLTRLRDEPPPQRRGLQVTGSSAAAREAMEQAEANRQRMLAGQAMQPLDPMPDGPGGAIDVNKLREYLAQKGIRL